MAHTVASQPFDEVKTAGDRPHIEEDWTPSQATRVFHRDFHPQLAAAMEIKKKSAGPVDQRSGKLTEEEFSDRINPQLDVITQMQAGAHEVEDASGASVLRHLDTQKLRSLLSATTWVKNFCRADLPGPGQGFQQAHAGGRGDTLQTR